jgi:gas vesicle protein
MNKDSSFFKGMGLGMAVGSAVGRMMPQGGRRKRAAARAARSLADMVDSLSKAINK